MRYRRLTIDETKKALDAGFVIMCADGDIFFETSNMMRATGLHSTHVHRAAFTNLRKSGYIKIDEKASKLPPSDACWTLLRNCGHFAIWRKD